MKKVRTHTNIKALDLLAERFVPLGFNKRKRRVSWWPGALKRNPERYFRNNGIVVTAIAAYDQAHMGADIWAVFHFGLALPSLIIMYRAYVAWRDGRESEA